MRDMDITQFLNPEIFLNSAIVSAKYNDETISLCSLSCLRP